MPINSHKFHEGQLQWNLQQASKWVKSINCGKSFCDWSCPQLPLPHCVGASPRDQQQLRRGLADGINTGTLTSLFLPPFSPPFPHFHTAFFVGSHGPCRVCTGQMDDLQIESNQKMLLIYSSSSLFQTHSWKNKSLFFQYDHRLLRQPGNY